MDHICHIGAAQGSSPAQGDIIVTDSCIIRSHLAEMTFLQISCMSHIGTERRSDPEMHA